MSVDHKVRLVQKQRARHGLGRCLAAVGLAQSTWYYRQKRTDRSERDAPIRDHIKEIIREHPDYGYRRLLPEVRLRTGQPLNHKRLRRILGTYDLGLPRALPKVRKGAIQAVLDEFRGQLDLLRGREGFELLEALSTDITELVYREGSSKAYLMAYIDVAGKSVLGWALSRRADRHLALAAWSNAKTKLTRLGRTSEGVIVHSDQDSIYTSHDYLARLLVEDRVKISYSERGCKDNPWIESFWGRMKVEIGSQISEAETFAELEAVIAERMSYYNTRRRHSRIGNRVPLDYLRTHARDMTQVLAKTGF